MARKKEKPILRPMKVKGRIATLKAILYKGSMVYIRMIGEEIFEYLVVFKNEIYSSYYIIKPKKGWKKLTDEEINVSAALAFAAATATIDYLLGEEVSEETKQTVEAFEKAGGQIWGKDSKKRLD